MQSSVLLFLPIVTGIIMGIMFGWEIGFGVAFLIGATSFYIENQFILAGVFLLIAIIFIHHNFTPVISCRIILKILYTKYVFPTFHLCIG